MLTCSRVQCQRADVEQVSCPQKILPNLTKYFSPSVDALTVGWFGHLGVGGSVGDISREQRNKQGVGQVLETRGFCVGGGVSGGRK